MEYLIKEKLLELKYQPGKGAWTYHLEIPNTKDIVGKWGTLKVSGSIDDYKIESINLFSIKGQNKRISINEKIRKSIHKSGGDFVLVTLYWITRKADINEKDIIETFKDADVLTTFNELDDRQKKEIISKVISQISAENQTKSLVQILNQLSKKKG